MSDKDFDDVLDINLKGVFIVSPSVCPSSLPARSVSGHFHVLTVPKMHLSTSSSGLSCIRYLLCHAALAALCQAKVAGPWGIHQAMSMYSCRADVSGSSAADGEAE